MKLEARQERSRAVSGDWLFGEALVPMGVREPEENAGIGPFDHVGAAAGDLGDRVRGDSGLDAVASDDGALGWWKPGDQQSWSGQDVERTVVE